MLAALGNPRALYQLESELARYGYLETLQVLQGAVARLEAAFWRGSLYHQLLSALCTLGEEPYISRVEQALAAPSYR